MQVVLSNFSINCQIHACNFQGPAKRDLVYQICVEGSS